MNVRERFHAIMNFEPFDRLPIIEWAGWWDKTLARWHTEGLAPELTDGYEIARHFGLDLHHQDWPHFVHWECPPPEEKGAPLVRDEADYDRLLSYFYRWPIDGKKWTAWEEEQRRGETLLWFTLDGFFWGPRTLLGIEPHFYAFYERPDLLHRMNSDLASWHLRVIDEICKYATPDFMTFAEDLSYNHGPMLSKALFDEFLLPYYRRVIPELHRRGILVFVDSDGDVTRAAEWFAEAGFDGMLPIERQAGTDIASVRARLPRMRFVGCFDKMTMHRGEAAMRAEFERLLPFAAQGGMAISCDHQTPPGVSLRDYELYLQLFREYAEKAARG